MKKLMQILAVAALLTIGYASTANAFDGPDPPPVCIPTPQHPNCD